MSGRKSEMQDGLVAHGIEFPVRALKRVILSRNMLSMKWRRHLAIQIPSNCAGLE